MHNSDEHPSTNMQSLRYSAEHEASATFDTDTVWPQKSASITNTRIVCTQWSCCVGRCDMQSRSFDICLSVRIHTLQNAVVCAALRDVFSPHNGDVTQGHVETTAPFCAPGPLENTGGNPSLIKNNTSSSPPLCEVHSCGCLLYVMIMRAGRKAMTL